MTPFICITCGTQYEPSDAPPEDCPVCVDERQYVNWDGQQWATHAELQAQNKLRIEEDNGVFALSMPAGFAIPQRAMHLPTDAGNILFECVSMVNDEAVRALHARGGVDRIIISHPHFYTSMVEWSEALGGVPILLNAADREWVKRSSPRIEFWEGDHHVLSPDVTLIRTGGHFPGCTALHWKNGPRPGGTLFAGDTPQVVFDRRHVTFMYSYPNYMPMKPSDVRTMRERLAGFEFEDVYGYTWGRNIIGGARAAVDASFDRYLADMGS
ncbi:MBL fold metallo-hydrolase [Pinirhizobacter soli]|uniref:MBL fold metallo-hydrolase n=1 Tax=Pinirhizobacter soli TaxID=2786953 RepID=UPI002029E4A5|nr:MBL fold metallo-hydrolase [Pinirhizobacter soli]